MKPDGKFQSIRARFIRWTVIITLCIGGVTALLFYVALRSVARNIGTDFAVEYTLREKGRIISPVERAVALCDKMAKMPTLADWLQDESNPKLRAAAMRDLESFRKEFRDHSCFLGIRDSGHYYFRDDSTGQKGDLPAYTMSPGNPKDAWFYSTLKNTDWLNLNVDKSVVRGNTMVWINITVYRGKERVAVAGTGLELDSFIKRLVNSQNKAVTPILVDPSGAIQAHCNPALIDQNTLSKKVEDRSTIYKLMPNKADREKLQQALTSLKSSPDSVITLPLVIEHQNRLVAVAYVPEINWYLISVIDLSKTVQNGEFTPLAIVAILALGIVVLAMTFSINRNILKPLSHLTKSAHAVAGGDYSVRAERLRNDEIGQLTGTFNSMLDTIQSNTRQLQRHSEELEQRVRERTSELEAEVKERKKAETAAHQANHAKSEFLANMSHEIRTPMNAILGFSEILSNKVQEPRQKEYVHAIYTSGKSLLNLINDVLDLSKVEAGKLRLEYAASDPRTVLKELEMVFSRKVEEKGLTYSTQVQDGFPTAVVLDETRLRQILLNLVGNAIKFTERGYVQVAAKMQQRDGAEGLTLVFEVRDSGIGIPADQLDNIFGAFEQRTGQSHAKYGGTGLGLTISKRLAELMGGKLTVESVVGEGSVFRVTLPNVEEAAMIDGQLHESAENHATVTFEPATILVAEDITLNRELIKGFLEGFQFIILEALNGRQAIEIAQARKPELILMDIKMPEMDGIQASTTLKSDPVTSSIPIVAVTASTMKSEEQTISTICNGLLRKPITRADLLNVLTRFLKHSTAKSAEVQAKPDEPLCASHSEEIYDSETLNRRLETELAPMWEAVRNTVIINQVLEFAEKAIAIAATHKYARLANWADKLRNQAMLFDMDGMQDTLAEFPLFLDGNRK